MDLVLHPPEEPARHRPHRAGRLSTVGHGAAFRAFARAAKRVGVRFMVIGGTFRDVAIRASSTRDIDVVLIDRKAMPADVMRAAGFTPVPRAPHAWRYRVRGRDIDVEVAALASSETAGGPFPVAFQHAETATIEGCKVLVPRIEGYVLLKLIAAAAETRRRPRDLADVQHALAAFPEHTALSVAALRARLRDVYGISGPRLKDLFTLLRHAARFTNR